MTFPSGGPGYPQQGGGQQPPGPPPSGGFPQQSHAQPASSGAAGLPQNLPLLLALVVAVFALVQYFLGFSDSGDVGLGGTFLLAGGLLAGLHALPKGPKTLPFAALFSVLGALDVLDALVSLQTSPGIVTVILILGILQMIAAVGALLIEYGVLTLPAPSPKPAAPAYAGQFGQPGGQYGQPGAPQYGQQQPQGPVAATGEPSAPFAQPGQYGSPNPPSTTPPPGPQATLYAPQQGQFFQQPPSDNPGTPPGGTHQQG